MNKKMYLKLYLSILIFVFLVFIVPSVFINMIGFIFLGLARPIMFLSKLIDLFIFTGIAMAITIVIEFIIWLNIRTVKKDGVFTRPINGLEFEKANFIQIRKKKFGLMTLATFELTNFKNLHYFFSNDEELKSWLEENDLIEFIVDKEYKFNKIKFWIKAGIITLMLGLVFRDAMTTNKTYRGDFASIQYSNNYYGLYKYNDNYIITTDRIYNIKTKDYIKYETTSSYPVNSEYYYSNSIYDIDVYDDYFVCKFTSTHMKRTSPNSRSGSGTPGRYIEEKIDYNGKSKGFIKDVDIEEVDYDFNPYDEKHSMNGYDIYMYKNSGSMDNLFKQYEKDIYDFSYSNKGKHTCYNLYGNINQIGDYYYFSLHRYGKRYDDRYIEKSGVYKYNIETRKIEVIEEFNGKKIISFNETSILYLDYKTLYKYDINTKTKTKVVKLVDYKDISIHIYKGNITLSCYKKNRDYYIDSNFNIIAKVRGE